LEHPSVIVHKIKIQADLAGDLVRMAHRERRKLVGEIVCPSADRPIWEEIQKNQDIQVELSTENNGPFATISCRAAVL